MKILNVIPSANLKGGGPIEGLRQTIPVIAENGSSNELLTLDLADSPFFSEIPTQVYGVGPSYTAWGYSPRLIPWLKEHAKEYDVVIVHGIWMFHVYATWQALHNTTTPYYIYTHGMLDPWFKRRYPLKHLKKLLFWPWSEYRALRDAKGVLFTTEDEKILARESFPLLYKAKEFVVNYGTSKPSGDPEEQKEVFLTAFPELKSTRNFLFLSRIHPKKGCDLLIKAFAKIAHTDSNLRLIMAGPDQVGLKMKLVKLAERLGISERVVWPGMLKDDLKWGAYYASEVFCLTSHQENFGIVVAEALACGLPVLITKQINIWREIESANAGFVTDDNQSGADLLLKTWINTSNEEKKIQSKNAFACFEKNFEIGQTVKFLLNTLDQQV